MKDDGDLDYSHCGGGGESGLGSGYIQKVLTIGFADRVAKEHEKKVKNITELWASVTERMELL